MSKQSDKNKEIVYADCNNGLLVFLPKDLALELAAIRTALDTSKTGGDFKANVPAHVYEEVIAAMKDDEEPEALPQLEDAFDSSAIPGYEDGDWPIWPVQEMLDWMPKDIQQQFGKVVPSVLNGDFLELAPEKIHEIVRALESRGFSCTEEDVRIAVVKYFHELGFGLDEIRTETNFTIQLGHNTLLVEGQEVSQRDRVTGRWSIAQTRKTLLHMYHSSKQRFKGGRQKLQAYKEQRLDRLRFHTILETYI